MKKFMQKSLLQVSMAAAVVATSFGFAPVAQSAALISPFFGDGLNEMEDSDRERVLRRNTAGGYDMVTSGNFAKDDIIQAILRFDTVSSESAGLNQEPVGDVLPAGNSLYAFSELVVDRIEGGVVISGQTYANGTPCDTESTCVLVFSATGNLGANVLASLYEGPTISGLFTQDPDGATGSIADIQGLNLIATVGLGALDDFWVSSIPNDPNAIGLIALASEGSEQRGQGQLGLSVLSNPGALPVLPNGIQSGYAFTYHDVVGNASAYAKTSGHPDWLVSSNTNIQFRGVPEPQSLALIGAAVCAAAGAGAVARRKNAS